MDGAIKTQKLLERHGLLDYTRTVVFFVPLKSLRIVPFKTTLLNHFL